ncbi:MAG: MFS transporter [Labilithrix sp.]|nr:MFS transporter [Labilithrix sp.]MCW5810420.1 MFS transporter [Labilithrix sp.]
MSSPQKTPGLGAIFLIVFLDILGFSLVLPFLAEESRSTFGTSELTGTLLASIYSLMQFVFVPVWGRVSDRVGRRPVLLWSITATALGMFGLGFALLRAEHIAWLFAARAASGIATANLGTASAYIADVTKPEERSKGMGLIGMAFGLGFILGPAIGGALSAIPIGGRTGAVPCFVAASLSCVNLGWAFVGLKESLPPERRAETKRSLSPLDFGAARDAFARPGIAIAVAVNFAITLSFTVLDQTFRFFSKDSFQMEPLDTGIVLAFIGVVAASVQGGLIRPLSRRFREALLIRVGTGIQAAAFAVIALSATAGKPLLYVGGALLALGNGMTQPSTGAFISKRADPSAQGATLGTNQSAASLARMFGPGLGGWVYGTLGPRSPYVLGAVGMFIAMLLAFGLDREPTEPSRRA